MLHQSSFVPIDKLLNGYIRTQLVYVAAKLGIADLICEEPRTVEDVAMLVEAEPDALRRMMAALVLLGVIERRENDTYQLAAGHEALCRDHPHSIRSYVILSGEVYYRAFAELLHSVKTGRPGSEAAFGMGFFAYLDEHPDAYEHFNIHMSRRVHRNIENLMAAYDFSPYRHVVDVGGGNGMLFTLLLQKYPQMRGTLFDLPTTQIQAQKYMEQAGVAERCQMVGGNFFVDELPGEGDLYVLSRIIHDWNDEQALRILQNCWRAMSPLSKLVLIESIRQEQELVEPVAKGDLLMLVITGGRERTYEEYQALLAQAGFQLTRVVPIEGHHSVIEAIPCNA
jgi:SAM-dependent methyltransferase